MWIIRDVTKWKDRSISDKKHNFLQHLSKIFHAAPIGIISNLNSHARRQPFFHGLSCCFFCFSIFNRISRLEVGKKRSETATQYIPDPETNGKPCTYFSIQNVFQRGRVLPALTRFYRYFSSNFWKILCPPVY